MPDPGALSHWHSPEPYKTFLTVIPPILKRKLQLKFMTILKNSPRLYFAVIASMCWLSACSSGDDNENTINDSQLVGNPDANSDFSAFVATRAPDFGSGEVVRISLNDGNTVNGSYPATESDIWVDTDGTNVYQIGRFQLDSITKFDPMDTSTPDYQLSVNGDDTATANPYDLAFVNDDKAYLTRRNGTKLWIVDPTPDNSPATVEDFLNSELDLSAYAKTTPDGNIDPPDMTDAIIVGDKLFVLMENLTLSGFNQLADSQAFLAVFDINTDQEINTFRSGSNLNGILLQTINPTSLQYNEETGLIYVVGRGNFFESPDVPGDPYTGGIESIDPVSYNSNLLLDDGDSNDNIGFFIDAIVISDTLGFLITLDGYDDNFNSISNLRTFNPTTREVSTPLEGTAAQDLTSMDVGPDGHLWVGINDLQSGFIRVDIASGEVAPDRVNTTLVPSNTVFINTAP